MEASGKYLPAFGKNSLNKIFVESIEEMNHPHNLYEKLGAVVVSGRMTVEQNKKGEWKKKFNFPSGWEKTFKHDYNKDVNGYAMLMGERTGMTGIDIDDPELPCAKQLIKLLDDCNMVQQTKKGLHYVFKYTPKLKQTTGTKEILIDIRNDGGCLFVEPTQASNPNGEIVADYAWIKTPLEDEELTEVPANVIEFLAKLDSRYIGAEKPKVVKVHDEEPSNNVASTENSSTETNPKNETDELLINVLEALPKKHFETYDDWVKIGMVCYHEGIPCSVWDTLSKKCENYENGACDKKWVSFKTTRVAKITSASLWKWLKEGNPNAFYSLIPLRRDILSLVTDLNHNDCARYFYNLNPDAYLWEQSLGWYSLTKNNIWKHYDNSEPSGMKRHIADITQELVKEAKQAELASYKTKIEKATDADEQKKIGKDHQAKMMILAKAYMKFGSNDFVKGIIAFLPSYYEKEGLTEIMDMKRNVFAFTDGLFDLEMCSFRMIIPQDYISTTTGYPYPKKLNKPIRKALESFMFGLFENNEDKDYLLKVLASCLFGGNRWEEFYVFTGTGGNGKGVISELLKTAFGDYYLTVDNSLFTKPLERKDQPIPALVEARCKRIMMSTEPESDEKLQAGQLKKISGNDIIEARTLHSKHIVKYVPQFKVILQMNNIPKMTKIDGGIERRMKIINFPFKFVGEDKIKETFHRLGDPDVKDKHCKSVEWRDEFILMLTEIYQKIKALKSLPPPSSVAEASNEYMDENNCLKSWLENYEITKDDKDQIGATELKRQYMDDCRIEKFGDSAFKNMMTFNSIKWKHTNKGNLYLGLKRKVTMEE
jgi:P4 family phage/plasmid primase-like protien